MGFIIYFFSPALASLLFSSILYHFRGRTAYIPFLVILIFNAISYPFIINIGSNNPGYMFPAAQLIFPPLLGIIVITTYIVFIIRKPKP